VATIEEKILKALKNKELSATAIAHELGYSKSKQIATELAKLVKDGSISVNKSGRFDVYSLAAPVAKSEKSESVTVVDGEKVEEKLPEAGTNDLRGFAISNIKYKGKRMKKVTTPNGKKIRMENDEKLLVINDEPKYVVKTAEDIITCIRKYSMENNLTVFTVSDIKQNQKISNEKDVLVKDNHVMFLSIKKHNKAA